MNEAGNSAAVLLIGRTVELYKVSSLCAAFSLPPHTAQRLLRSLRVPIVSIGADDYFSVDALETALYYVSRFGGPGFAAPGSRTRSEFTRRQLKKKGLKIYTQISDQDLASIDWKSLKQEMSSIALSRSTAAQRKARILVRKVGRSATAEKLQGLWAAAAGSAPAVAGQAGRGDVLEDSEAEAAAPAAGGASGSRAASGAAGGPTADAASSDLGVYEPTGAG